MKLSIHPSKPGLMFPTIPARRAAFATVTLLVLLLAPGGWTQYPGPPATLLGGGPTLGTNLRNAAAATHAQTSVIRRSAQDWGRRAGWATYRVEHFQQDFGNAQTQFLVLRQQFNALGNLALQLGRPRANNAVAELDAGLNIIAELFTFLESQFNAGTLDQKTIVRTCRALDDTIQQWDGELKRNSSRIGLVW